MHNDRRWHRDSEESDMNDLHLRQNVLDEFEFEPSIDAANIGVAAKDGVVTLTGHLPSYARSSPPKRLRDASRACAQWRRKSRSTSPAI
jgi:hypothetical protein